MSKRVVSVHAIISLWHAVLPSLETVTWENLGEYLQLEVRVHWAADLEDLKPYPDAVRNVR